MKIKSDMDKDRDTSDTSGQRERKFILETLHALREDAKSGPFSNIQDDSGVAQHVVKRSPVLE